MAINVNQNNDDEQSQGMNNTLNNNQQQQNQDQMQLASAPASNTSQPTSSQPSATPAPVAQSSNKAPASSGTFTNLRSYLNANQGNRIGSAASQRLQNTATGAQKAITQGSNAFSKRVESGSLANRQQAVQDVSNISQAARQVQAQPAAPAAQPQQQAQASTQAQVGVVQPTTSGVIDRGTQETAQPAQASAAPKYLSDEQTQRFADIINAQYKGPQSLRDAGLFENISQKIGTAQDRLKQVQTAQGRESYLKDLFGQNRAYNQGQNKLDSLLLNANQSAVQNLLDKKQQIGNLGQKLEQAQNESSNLATQRAQEIAGIQQQARDTFGQAQTAERAATDERLSKVVENWDQLPEYYKNIIRNKEQNNKALISNQQSALDAERNQVLGNRQSQLTQQAKDLQKLKEQRGLYLMQNFDIQQTGNKAIGSDAEQASKNAQLNALDQQIAQATQNYNQQEQEFNQLNNPFLQRQAEIDQFNTNQAVFSGEEAALLGLQSGQGLYNLGEDAIKTAIADKERLASRDEVARQLALQQLAQLDAQKRLNTNVKYGNLDKAGTQTALDALDVEATQRAIQEAEDLFRQSAEGANLVGQGQKKVSRGNAFGKKTKTYYSGVGGNAADMLRQAGYDFDTAQALASGEGNAIPGGSILQNKDALGNYLKATSTQYDQDPNTFLQSTAAGAGAGAAIGSVVPVLGTGVGALIGGTIGGAIDSGTPAELAVPGLGQATLITNAGQALDEMGVPIVGAVGKAVQDTRNIAKSAIQGVGNSIGGSLGSGISSIGSAIGGIDQSAMKAYGTQVARQKAIQDLQKKYAAYLQGQGFENRVNVANTDETLQRTEGLRQLLAGLDKTNLG